MPVEVNVELNQKTNRIVLKCDYYVGVAQDCKAIQGYKFDGDDKVWTYPLRMQTCHALRQVFGDRLVIGPILTTWARKSSVLYAKQRGLSQKPDSELTRVRESHLSFWEAMSSRPYQRSGAEFLAMTGHAADFSEPGLGKTATALASLIQAGNWNGRHLVVVSNKTAIRSTWAEEIRKWTPDAKVYPMPDGWQKREKMLDRFWEDDSGPRFVVMLPHMLQIKQGHWCKKCAIWQEDANAGKFYEEEQEDGTVIRKKTVVPSQHYGDNHRWELNDMKIDWPELFDIEWDSIIADEAHDYLLKIRDARAAGQPQWAVGMRRLRIRKGGTKLPMTGTPIRGKEQNLFGIFHWLDPVRFSSFWGWAGTYFEVVENSYLQRGPGQVTGVSRSVGRLRPEMEAAFYDVLDSLALRRTKREVRAELPPLMPQEHWVEMEGEHLRQYKEFETLGIARMDNGYLEGLGLLSELTRLRQLAFGPGDMEHTSRKPKWPKDAIDDEMTEEEFNEQVEKGWMIEEHNMVYKIAESPKVQLVLDMLRERGLGGPEFTEEKPDPEAPKFIIASQYVKTLDGIGGLLDKEGVPWMKITGAVSAAQRSKNVKNFQTSGGPRVMLLNTKAGGASLTLDRYCDEMFVLDETWIHDDQVQLMGRIDNRTGEVRPRFIHYIRTRDTVDEGIAVGNDDQNTLQAQILDSRRGPQVALRLLRRGND
jgi:SNF2 family DNA or RNA helicase